MSSHNLTEIINDSNNFRKNYKNKVRDSIVSTIYENAEELSKNCVNTKEKIDKDKKIDDILTSKKFGIPIMFLILLGVLWITIEGANYPSELIAKGLFYIEDKLMDFLLKINTPKYIYGPLVFGLYRTLAWVISVMLPPMAIFFPIFTILEDLGYLPRVAFNVDHLFQKCRAHGKQALTMCMGFGCNAAGIVSCRIIDSERERLIAILTNNFIPCNGRFPSLIAMSSIFFGIGLNSKHNSIKAAFMVAFMVLIGIAIIFLCSYVLSKTLLKGVPSSFALELPPYRKPQILKTLYTSLIDRTIFVLGRAIVVAAPAGIITYILSNIYVGNLSLLSNIANFLNPFAKAIGLDGFILTAFILGFPANEIVIPVLLMAYLSKGAMLDFTSLESLKNILLCNGWTNLTALNFMLFSVLHFPCGTTALTIKKETGSKKWTFLSMIIPTLIAIVVCFLTTCIYKLLNL